MTAKEYNEADRDVIGVCSANHNRWKAAEEKRAAIAYSDSHFVEGGSLMTHRRKQLKRVFFTCARASFGMLFLGAIPRGWMDPGMALIMAAASFIWALHYFFRGYRYGE